MFIWILFKNENGYNDLVANILLLQNKISFKEVEPNEAQVDGTAENLGYFILFQEMEGEDQVDPVLMFQYWPWSTFFIKFLESEVINYYLGIRQSGYDSLI